MGHDSLFGSDDDENEEQDTIESIQDSTVELQDKYDAATGRAVEEPAITIATTKTPNIKGFYLIRNLVPPQMQDALFKRIIAQKAITLEHPQAMLFPRATSSGSDVENCPTYLADFVKLLPDLLKAHLSPEDFDITFDERQPLQTILNLYEPGQGISPHVRAESLTKCDMN